MKHVYFLSGWRFGESAASRVSATFSDEGCRLHSDGSGSVTQCGSVQDRGSNPDQSPVHSPAGHATGPAVPQQSSAGPPPSPRRSKALYGTRSPAPPSDPEPSFDSASFWKSCNAAGCTQALFTGFIDEMNNISSRIQSDLASQEDYDSALTVMTASGKLAERVAKQHEALQRKQTELQKATAAMKEVVSALRT
ncbi:PHD finger protein 11-like [Cebidichthys violaceus]|uniref:PHD finger protein 11-like n=1 Tax=Cebidichthys violaceus TaxID=271503 RepID=UPI0035C967A8